MGFKSCSANREQYNLQVCAYPMEYTEPGDVDIASGLFYWHGFTLIPT